MNEDMAVRTLARVEREQTLLRKGVEAVGFDMSHWFANEDLHADSMGNICNTTACFAGHGALVGGYAQHLNSNECVDPESGEILRWSEAGREVLDLTGAEADHVFHLSDLPAVYRWVADRMGVDEQVLRDKVQAEVG